ncbi:AAA family ATPase [Larkinella sp. GY13]|uniref:AAA family ATPase n=1 Tax=Larkinella sp. GY13 TaxID=3453720 RepID=UPI003EE999D6
MRNIIGQAVSGSDFFERPQIIQKIHRALRNGNQVYLSAPRRVGKTSIMNYLQDNPETNQHYVYAITQSIDTTSTFYQEIARQVLESPSFGKLTKASETLKKITKNLLQHITIKVSIPFVELSTEKGQAINFQIELEKLLEELDLEGGKLIIMVDEFTETLDNILIKDGKQEARRFLQTFRELMHNRKLTHKVQFLLTGSIGLQPLVKKLEGSDLINQLLVIDIPPLTEDEACSLFRRLIQADGIEITDETIRSILQKIDWLMPFHVQLLVQEVIDVFESLGNPIDEGKAKQAFEQVFHQRNRIYFEQYYERLKKRLEPGSEYNFVHEVLNRVAQTDSLEKAIVHDLAVKNNFSASYKATMESLQYDGYLHETADNQGYRFNSSILKTWWKKYVS